MRVVTREQLRMKLDGELRRCRDDGKPILVIDDDETENAVIMNTRDYGSLMETMHIYEVPGLREKILRGMKQVADLQCDIDLRNH